LLSSLCSKRAAAAAEAAAEANLFTSTRGTSATL
jgi:hypothetical protein